MNTIPESKGERLGHEIREFIPAALFFVVAFQLLALTQSLILHEHGIRISSFVAAAVGGLIVAKVILIADHFPFINRFPAKPLAYNVAWRTAVYFAATIVARYIEQLVHFWRQSGSFAAANQSMATELNWAHLLCVHLWLLVFLLIYCAATELVRRLGAGWVYDLYFKDRHRSLHAGIE